MEIEISRLSESHKNFVRETENAEIDDAEHELKPVKVLSLPVSTKKKIEVEDFVKNFRNRFNEIRGILQEHVELEGLASINKLSERKKVSIIGAVLDKRITKNKNVIFEVEDLTGRVKVLINQTKPELYSLAEEISLDSVLGFSGVGNKEIIFANNIVFPDTPLIEKKKSPVEEYALFISDLQYGSGLFMEENFKKFIEY